MNGFSLIEIVIVIALVGVIATTGIVFGLDSHSRFLCRTERDTLIALLAEARSRSINNYRTVSHGVHIEEEKYVLFFGELYLSTVPTNETTLRSSSIEVFSPSEIVFEQLTGNLLGPSSIEIIIGTPGSACHEIIYLNHEAGISW